MGWTSIYQLFWCSPGVQGFDPSPYIFVDSRGPFHLGHWLHFDPLRWSRPKCLTLVRLQQNSHGVDKILYVYIYIIVIYTVYIYYSYIHRIYIYTVYMPTHEWRLFFGEVKSSDLGNRFKTQDGARCQRWESQVGTRGWCPPCRFLDTWWILGGSHLVNGRYLGYTP